MFHVEPLLQETLLSCPICGGVDFVPKGEIRDHHLTQELFHLTTCSACGFDFTNPRPKQEQIGRYYASENYISHTDTATSISDRLYRFARNWALRKKHRLVALYKPKGRLLDVGCGTGAFLGYMKSRGFEVAGVEPSDRARSIAALASPGSVVPALADVDRKQPFEVGTLWHVLEHLPDLRSAFREFHSLLCPGGVLFIAVPDRTSWDCSHYGQKWAAWDVPRHLSHFRPKDIETLMTANGFRLVSTRRMWLDAPYICMLSERYRGRGPLVSLLLGILKGTWSNLVALTTGGSTSSALYIGRKR